MDTSAYSVLRPSKISTRVLFIGNTNFKHSLTKDKWYDAIFISYDSSTDVRLRDSSKSGYNSYFIMNDKGEMRYYYSLDSFITQDQYRSNKLNNLGV
jgi:hypothetical protein